MPPQIKQAKLREEFIKEFPHAFDHEDQYNLNRDEVIDWWLTQLSQAKLETLEAIIKEVEGMSEANRNSIDKVEEKTEADRMTNLLNENMVFGYQTALSDLLTKLQAEKELIENGVEEIPQMKGTREALDKLTLLKNER